MSANRFGSLGLAIPPREQLVDPVDLVVGDTGKDIGHTTHKNGEGFLALVLLQPIVLEVVLWCPGAESNHRHRDFQSRALPTELPGREARHHGPREAPTYSEAARDWQAPFDVAKNQAIPSGWSHHYADQRLSERGRVHCSSGGMRRAASAARA